MGGGGAGPMLQWLVEWTWTMLVSMLGVWQVLGMRALLVVMGVRAPLASPWLGL